MLLNSFDPMFPDSLCYWLPRVWSDGFNTYFPPRYTTADEVYSKLKAVTDKALT